MESTANGQYAKTRYCELSGGWVASAADRPHRRSEHRADGHKPERSRPTTKGVNVLWVGKRESVEAQSVVLAGRRCLLGC